MPKVSEPQSPSSWVQEFLFTADADCSPLRSTEISSQCCSTWLNIKGPVIHMDTICCNTRKTGSLSTQYFYAVCIVFTTRINLLKPTGYVMHQQFIHSTTVRSAHTVFMCFVFIWEQTATCATYSINWLVFITEMTSFYCAVRTGL